MTLRKVAFAICVPMLLAGLLPGQTVSSSIVGTVLDPASAVVAGAKVTLTDTATGNARNAVSDVSGIFRFAELAPSTYTLSVQAAGFKSLTETNIVVEASQTRDLGKLALAVGSVSESVSVTAEATPIQLASSEKATGIDAIQLSNVTLKGRDMFGYLSMVPGVIDTTASRDVTTPNAIGGIYINGNNGSKINFTVDGVTDLDTGSNSTVHYEPNMDSIQELKVLTSNYQAEFGRNSGGTITAVTKSGTKDFHATGMWTHRHEGFNANSWLNNHSLTAAGTAQPIPRYRYNVESYTVGGPVTIPKLFNRQRNKLFFFWAQEYTGQFVTGGAQTKYTPTALERQGDFSQTFANNGSLVVITDPTTNAPFPGNRVPVANANPVGLAMLNFFPLPNFTATASNQLNVVNYFESASATHPRRNDVLRVDTYITPKLSGYFRWINDHDDMIALYQGVQFSQDKGGLLGEAGIAPIDHPNPGHGYSGTATYSITPTLINEFTVAESWNTWAYYSTDNYKTEDRSLIPNLPALFPIPTQNPAGVSKFNGYLNLLPQFQFGSPPSNSMTYTRNQTSAGNEENFNTIWTFSDNISKVVRTHSFKVGAYIERNAKLQPGSNPYSGSFNFSPDSLNALYNTGNGYANAYLGYVDIYQQATARATFNVHYWNAEFYVQDNWRVTPRLTLDYGVRFYHQPPQNDVNLTFSEFFPAQYSKSAAPRIYVPGMSGGKRVAIDPGNGTVAPVAYIGLYVPNSGNPADGFQLMASGKSPTNTYNISPVAAAPRTRFAYDLTGDGKTAVRGGFGIFYNRLDGNQVYAMAGQPPYGYTPQLNYTTMGAIASSGGNLIFGPQTYTTWPQNGNVPWNGARNASIDIQRSVAGFAIDLGYTGNWSFNQNISYNINPIAIGTRFLPGNLDPTNGNKPLPDVLLRSVYPGFNTINQYAEIGNTNYNALTASAQRRLSNGLSFQLAYTYSKAMYLNSFTPVVANNDAWNYGRSNTDRRHHLVINYLYELPKASKYAGKFIGVFADNWIYSGVMVYSSGGPFNPGFGFASGSTPDYTGTPDVSARIGVVGNPYANVPAGAFFNPNAFALPALGTASPATPVLGNLGGGSGVLSYPHFTNFDMTMIKHIPVGLGERRGLDLQIQAYNVFNHTEYNALNTTIQFNPSTNAVVNPLQAGTPSGTLPNRILAFGIKFIY